MLNIVGGGNNSKLFPKIIWRYWHQGWDNAPFPLNYITESIHHYAPDWELIDLDCKSAKNYIEIPAEVDIPNFPLPSISDLTRIKLLEKYGGVWIDPTVFLNQNLTEFLEPLQGDFFCFWRWEHKVAMSNWFLAAKKGSYIAKLTSEAFSKAICSPAFIQENQQYFGKWRGSPNYFIFHHTFESLIQTDKGFAELIKAMPFRDSLDGLIVPFYGWNKPVPSEYEHLILEKAPMVKLSYSVKEHDYNPESSLGFLLKKMKGEMPRLHHYLHVNTSLRTSRIYDSFINCPDKVGEYAGQFESEGDLKITPVPYSHYHVYNFSSMDRKHGAQLLIPHDTARIFLRFQQGNSYSEARELAFLDDTISIKALAEQNIGKLSEKMLLEALGNKKELARLAAEMKKASEENRTLRLLLHLALNRRPLQFRYFLYRLASHITLGKLRCQCTQEKRRLRALLLKMKSFDSTNGSIL